MRFVASPSLDPEDAIGEGVGVGAAWRGESSAFPRELAVADAIFPRPGCDLARVLFHANVIRLAEVHPIHK